MPKLSDHPTVKRVTEAGIAPARSKPLDAAWLRELVLDAGADDVGFVSIDRPELDDQRGNSKGLNAVYHFVFTGETPINLTVTIRDQTITKVEGLHGDPDVTVTADGEAWVRFLNRKMSGVFAFITRKIRLDGDPRLLVAFGNCFPF